MDGVYEKTEHTTLIALREWQIHLRPITFCRPQ